MIDCQMCSKWLDEPEMRVAELEHSYVLLNRDQFFPGYCFVFTKTHVTELFHLDQDTRAAIIEEVNAVAAALFAVFQPTKINYELLGNMVPHMHWHIVPRFTTDPLWPRPIWSDPHEPLMLSPDDYRFRIQAIAELLSRR
ncbi:HIT family protein [Geobacter pelophilus]|uniref:HIT family protein n=1 Tax=Geoanaerobacter pelophilus TaxID=60036 RepID=A0AAW4L5K6_9BACT|nr:HIT family protein [Geoanaerobacter pelophilus]MBT0665447.1 HIT family protein [Geoanaerobacter pelophilus]